MRRLAFHFWLLWGGAVPSSFAADSPQQSLPFVLGEKLEYEMKWGFIPVGSAKMEVFSTKTGGSQNSIVVSFQVRTNSFADAFYKVRTSITSTLDASFSRTLRYEKSQREGRTVRDIVVEYDYKSNEARYSDKEGKRLVTSIPGPVFDPLSIAYFVRLHPLSASEETFLPTCDGKRFRNVRIRAGEPERLKLPIGEVEAIGTVPAMENLGGVFQKSPKGMLKVWYTQDDRRVPVRVSSKVAVGSFTAVLKNAYPPLMAN